MAQWNAPRCPKTRRDDGDHGWETCVADVTRPNGSQERVTTVVCRYCGKQKGKPRVERQA